MLLSSSLSADYDVSKALAHVNGRIYNYYSPNDAVLTQLMRVACTIDGKIAGEGAGAKGLHPAHSGDRVVNIEWRPEFQQYGYFGGHFDSTSPAFVREFVSKQLIPQPQVAAHETEPAMTRAPVPRVAHLN